MKHLYRVSYLEINFCGAFLHRTTKRNTTFCNTDSEIKYESTTFRHLFQQTFLFNQEHIFMLFGTSGGGVRPHF